MKTSLKDWPKAHRKFRGMKGLSDEEKIAFARFDAATPDERLQMNNNCIKALGLWGGIRSLRDIERRKAKLRSFSLATLAKFQLSDEELANGRMFASEKLK